jgi:ACR3 family arsenite efflux pump ArsB
MSVSFFKRFLIHMMLPIGCTLAILLALFVARTCTAKTDRAKRVRIQETVSKILIMVILLLFPGLSTKIFQVWKCTTVDGLEGEFLVQDYSITCNEGEHVTYILVAGSFLLVYIVGIPFTMFVLMWRNRKSLHD